MGRNRISSFNIRFCAFKIHQKGLGSVTDMSKDQQQSAKMWSGRFREPLDPTFESWQRSFPFDWRLVPYEVEASIAHARAIQSAGILTSEELLQMEEGLRAVAKQQAEQGEAVV